MARFETIYLTGAPAAGKSSLTRALADLVTPLEVWEFGERLTEYVNTTRDEPMAQADLRRESAKAASPQAVEAVDDMLLRFVANQRTRSHVIIDSHPVTKEEHGYRVTPYSLARFAELRPTQIWVLYTDPAVAIRRIAADAQGRPTITTEEARFHTYMQASVGIAYGMSLGIPVHFFDSDRIASELAQELSSRF